MSPTMIHDATADLTSQVRARAKVLARQDRALMSSLLRLRHGAGLTQKAVAERMGISQQAVNKLERYDSDPKLSTLRRYANSVGAIVEHRVSPDLGQSVAMANEPAWGTWGGPAKVVAIPLKKRPPTPGDHWSTPRAVVLIRDVS